MLKEVRVRIALVLVLAVLAGGSIFAGMRGRGSGETPIIITTPASASQPSTSSAPTVGGPIAVHITGAVKSPSIYQLPAEARLADAIKVAGGSKSDADLNAVNLAEKLHDGEKVYIPTHDDTKAIPPMVDASPQNAIGDQPATPNLTSDEAKSTMGSSGMQPPHMPKKPSQKSDKLTSPSQGTVNINTANIALLMRLPGVGKTTAERIVAYRTGNGPFKKPEDIMNVSGIGPKKYAKMAPLIRVS